MLSKSTFAGAGSLLAAPIVVIVANLVRPTISDDAGKQVAAFIEGDQLELRMQFPGREITCTHAGS